MPYAGALASVDNTAAAACPVWDPHAQSILLPVPWPDTFIYKNCKYQWKNFKLILKHIQWQESQVWNTKCIFFIETLFRRFLARINVDLRVIITRQFVLYALAVTTIIKEKLSCFQHRVKDWPKYLEWEIKKANTL